MTKAKRLITGSHSSINNQLMVCSGLAVLSLATISLPAQSAGFLDLSMWTNATACSAMITSSCVESPGAAGFDYDVIGTELGDSPNTYTITSPPAPEDIYVSFYYGFTPTALGTKAEYSTNGLLYVELPTASPGALVSGVPVGVNQNFSFRLTTNNEKPFLAISDFSSTPVPTPLPLLGAGAYFSFARRLRSRLKAGQDPR